MQIALTIAGYDPSSGAGITADLLTFAAHGHFGTSAITALTVQSTRGVISTHPVAPALLRSTLLCLAEDLTPAGVKIGMLATAANVREVAAFISTARHIRPGLPVVLDPVVRSTSGRDLLDGDGVEHLRRNLLPSVNWVTPNTGELALLLGRPSIPSEDLVSAARDLQALGRELNVVVTGGHLDPPDDLLVPASGEPLWIPGRRIESTSTHGTGCAFSSALLSRLLLGDTPEAAVRAAKAYVAGAIIAAPHLGSGHGPLHHLWSADLNRR